MPSGRLSPGMLRQVLLEDGGIPEVQIASASGRPVRQEGMTILIGNDSSSESDVEESFSAGECIVGW